MLCCLELLPQGCGWPGPGSDLVVVLDGGSGRFAAADRVGPADWPTPSPAERRKLLRDALRLSLWRATAGSTGAWLVPEIAALTGMPTLWPLVGALFSFLLWNWSPAKVFMGDVGSTFLGAVFAGVVLQQTSFSAALALLLIATPLLADACLCVPRRLFAGQRIFQAHRLHLFQRLHQAGWCHAHVSSLYIAATAVLAIAHLAGGLVWVIGFALAVLLIGVWLDQHVAVSFAVASKR